MIGLWSQVADSVIHSDTVAIVGIVAGVVGTLLGATVGLLGSWWIQKRQLEHEDETRFHDRRLAVYAEFNDACGKLVSAKQVNADIATVNQHLSRVLIAWENLRLIASGPVVAAARPIHAAMGKAIKSQVSAADLEAIGSQFIVDGVKLENAIRKELGLVD